MSGYDPLRLPAPVGYGYDSMGGRAPIQANHAFTMGQLPDQQSLPRPETVRQRVEDYGPDFRMPDAVRASISPGDRQVVGELLKIVNGEASDFKVSPSIAGELLDSWGYPRDPDAWSYDEWQAAMEKHILEPTANIGY